MIDSNERVTILDSRNTNELAKRVIDTVLSKYVVMKENNNPAINEDLLKERARAMLNKLFIKYACMEFESIFQTYFIDRKIQ